MNAAEARRYAHKLVAEFIARVTVDSIHHDDKAKITDALADMRETHARFGPRSTDRAPRLPEYTGEMLQFEDVSGEIDTRPDASDPGEQIAGDARCPDCDAPAGSPNLACQTCCTSADEHPAVL